MTGAPNPIEAAQTSGDLPAPVSREHSGPPLLSLESEEDLLAPVAGRRAPPKMPDLMTPAAPALPDNLPAPRTPYERQAATLPENLPAPRSKAPPLPKVPPPLPDNLPAPRAKAPPPLPDNLPAPRATRPMAGGLPENLPAPRTDPGDSDLLTPVGPYPGNLPAPVGAVDLPTPVDPTSRPNMPAPKGFFDDGVAPAGLGPAGTLPAPKGFFDGGVAPADVARSGTLPAPKGFFDDGVAPTGPEAPARGGLPAPKGFFEDIEIGDAGGEALDLGEPLGPAGPPSMPDGPFDLGEPLDLGASGPATTEPDPGLDFEGIDLEDSGGAALDLGEPLEQRPFGLDGLDLEAPNHSHSDLAAASPFEDVSLPGAGGFEAAPSMPSSDGVVSFSTPSASAVAEGQQRSPMRRRPAPSDVPLELDESALPDLGRVSRTVASKPVVDRAPKPAGRKRLIAMSAVLVVLGLGAGGYYAYDRWTAGKAAESKIARNLQAARAQIALDNPGHWVAAAGAADKVLAVDRDHVEANALRAQAYFAAVIDEGVQIDLRLVQGKKSVNHLRKLAASGPEVDKAEALMAIVERRHADALARLGAARNRAPRDPWIHLYGGWAHAAKGDWQKAANAFEAMLKIKKEHVAARFGLAEALLAVGEKDRARDEYAALIADYRKRFNRDHVGALVGAAQLVEVEKFSEREERYKELLARQEYAQADPRAISKVGALAGIEALRAGRTQEASQRFAAALRLDPGNLLAVIGEGELLYAEGRYDAARERLSRVLSVDPNNVLAALALAAVAVKQENLTEAKQLLAAVFEREPPVTESALLARAHRVRARVYSLEPQMIDKAESEYREAMKLAGENSIDAALELARFLVSRERDDDAKQVLDPIRERAKSDPSIAVSLGVAYLGAGDPVSAESSFRAALAQRANDVEARYQLGAALLAQKRDDEGLAALEAAYSADRSREDIGVFLAVAYEERKRFKEAEALYEKLLAAGEPSINVKAGAGRYFARHGSMERAIALGEAIAAEQPRHPAALYLTGEKEFLANNFDDAQRLFLDAADSEPAAQFYEAAGRAAERNKLFPDALDAYGKASAAEPDFLAPRLGSARIYRARRQFSKAIEELDAALELAPDNAWAHFARGDSFLELRQEKQAVAALRRAVQLDPELAEASYKLGRALYDLDKPRDAAAALARARRHAGDDPWLTECLRLLGYAYRQSGRRREAIEAFKAYEERNPEDGPTFRDARNTRIYLEGGGR